MTLNGTTLGVRDEIISPFRFFALVETSTSGASNGVPSSENSLMTSDRPPLNEILAPTVEISFAILNYLLTYTRKFVPLTLPM